MDKILDFCSFFFPYILGNKGKSKSIYLVNRVRLKGGELWIQWLNNCCKGILLPSPLPLHEKTALIYVHIHLIILCKKNTHLFKRMRYLAKLRELTQDIGQGADVRTEVADFLSRDDRGTLEGSVALFHPIVPITFLLPVECELSPHIVHLSSYEEIQRFSIIIRSV